MLSKFSTSDISKAVTPSEFPNTGRPYHSGVSFDIPFTSQDEKEDANEEDVTSEEKEQIKKGSNPTAELFRISTGKNFQELLAFFGAPNQQAIQSHRNFLQQQQSNMTRTSRCFLNSDADQIRSHLYQVQVQLFSAPMGDQFCIRV